MKDGSRERGQGLGEKIRKNTWCFAPSQPASTHITSRGKRGGGMEGTLQHHRQTDTVLETCMGKEQRCVCVGGGGGELFNIRDKHCWNPLYMYRKSGGGWGRGGGAELFNIMVRHCAENHPAPVWVGFEEDVHGAWSVRVLGDHEWQDDLYGHQGNSKQRQSLLGHPRLD